MTSTSYLVELLVVGLGALAALVPLLAAALGVQIDEETFSANAAVPALAVAYVLGIVVGRLADLVFGRLADHLRRGTYPERHDYEDDFAYVFHHSDLRSLLEQDRSRIRITRGWSLNALIGLITSNIYICATYGGGSGWKPAVTLNLTLFTVLAGCLTAYIRLRRAGYSSVKTLREALRGGVATGEGEADRAPR